MTTGRKICITVIGGLLIYSLLHAMYRKPTVPAHAQSGMTTVDTLDPTYLRLDPGKQWVLRDERSRLEIKLTVENVRDGLATVSFKNPWLDSAFVFRQNKEQTILTALNVRAFSVPMPADTVYFDFGAPAGKSWQNTIGKIEVVSTHKQVGKYDDCIQFQETNKQGQKNLWSFARSIGFVQFGDGKDAFILDESASHLTPDAAKVSNTPSPHPLQISVKQGWQGTRIALAYNTFAKEWLTPFSVNRHFRQAVGAGIDYVYLSPKWAEIEPSPEKYKFKDLDFEIGLAEKAGLPTILQLRVIDTGARPVPEDLAYKSFDDAVMVDRFNLLIDALAPHLKGHTAYLLIGNEIDAYFRNHPSEISAYVTFFRTVKSHAQSELGGIPTSTTITFDGLDNLSQLRPLLEQEDYFSLTYYPLTPDFTVRDPTTFQSDFEQILRAAGSHKILFQEFGYPSSDCNNSSQEKQAQAFAAFLDLISEHRSSIIGADFLFMSDFSDSVTANLTASYHMQNAPRFGAFLQTLGMFDSDGSPKKSWAIFTAKVPPITSNN